MANVRHIIAILPPLAFATLLALQNTKNAAPAEDPVTKALSDSYKLQNANDYIGALRCMKTVFDSNPKLYFPRLRIAYLELLANDYAAAAESYKAAALAETNAVEPILGLQLALVSQEKYDDAEKAGRDALARDPKNYYGMSRLAWTYYKRNNFVAAVELYQKVLALYPSDADMRSGLGYSHLALGKKVVAEGCFRDALAIYPSHAGATAGLGYCK
ncbi:MAG: tetratricopeptide repeat protein [Planctomycetes bacterium]|nr:tetratricopeptide repeat protein [Planctomycetota bacterium]